MIDQDNYLDRKEDWKKICDIISGARKSGERREHSSSTSKRWWWRNWDNWGDVHDLHNPCPSALACPTTNNRAACTSFNNLPPCQPCERIGMEVPIKGDGLWDGIRPRLGLSSCRRTDALKPA